MSNMSDTKVVVQGKLDTPNGLAVDWIANNLYWTDNEYKVRILLPRLIQCPYSSVLNT